MRVNSIIRSSIRTFIYPRHSSGLPSSGLLLFAKSGTTDNIGVLSTDYDKVGTDLQGVLYSAPNMPITFDTWQDLYDTLATLPNFNLLNYMANSTTILFYEDGTSREILNKALLYLKLPEVYDPFGPTWSDAEIWNDNKIWSEA